MIKKLVCRFLPINTLVNRRVNLWAMIARQFRGESGMTLIEVMIVIVILGLLATGIAVNVLPKREQAKVAKAVQDIAALENSFQMYSLDVGDYPSTEDGIQSLWRAPQPAPDNWRGPYIQKPNFTDPWGTEYVYVYPGNHEGYDYDLYSLGKDTQEGTDDDITSWIIEETQ